MKNAAPLLLVRVVEVAHSVDHEADEDGDVDHRHLQGLVLLHVLLVGDGPGVVGHRHHGDGEEQETLAVVVNLVLERPEGEVDDGGEEAEPRHEGLGVQLVLLLADLRGVEQDEDADDDD